MPGSRALYAYLYTYWSVHVRVIDNTTNEIWSWIRGWRVSLYVCVYVSVPSSATDVAKRRLHSPFRKCCLVISWEAPVSDIVFVPLPTNVFTLSLSAPPKRAFNCLSLLDSDAAFSKARKWSSRILTPWRVLKKTMHLKAVTDVPFLSTSSRSSKSFRFSGSTSKTYLKVNAKVHLCVSVSERAFACVCLLCEWGWGIKKRMLP